MISNNCSLNEHILAFMVIAVAMIGFAVNETLVVAASSNSTNSDKQKIIGTWLETNDTEQIDTPMISISDEDFWMVFEPLLKQSINGSISSFE
jgi:hypothetical protein